MVDNRVANKIMSMVSKWLVAKSGIVCIICVPVHACTMWVVCGLTHPDTMIDEQNDVVMNPNCLHIKQVET